MIREAWKLGKKYNPLHLALVHQEFIISCTGGGGLLKGSRIDSSFNLKVMGVIKNNTNVRVLLLSLKGQDKQSGSMPENDTSDSAVSDT